MKRGMIVAVLCGGIWMCGNALGQETVVTNLIVKGTVSQGTNAIAAGSQSTAFGEGAMADGDYSHAEGDTTTAGGTASHAEGALTVAGGDQSHAEGLATEALAGNSHAGGAYARVRTQDSNSFIHATGTATNDMKETQYSDTAHFDHLVTLEPAVDSGNAVLSRSENDQRYLQSGAAITVSAVRVMGNVSEALGAAVSGGSGNMAGANAFVGSGTGNTASNSWAAIGGGGGNTASGVASFIGAGGQNTAVGNSAFVGAGSGNIAAGYYCTFVGAGAYNFAYADYAAIVAGRYNYVSNLTSYSFIGGGYSNYLAGRGYSAIVGGWGNAIASTNTGPTAGRASFIGGGYFNKISGPYAAIPGGSANVVDGSYGAVTGGRSNLVAGSYGMAGGYGAQALHDGSWVWADAHAEPFASIASNEFAIRAAGGLRLEGRNSVGYDPEIGTNQYALWVRNFGATPGDARGLLVTTPEYNGGAGILFHAASMAGSSMASRFIVGADGNVGVGVNDPQNRLHVAGDVRVSGDLLMMDGQNILSPNFTPGTWGSGYDAWGPNAYLKYGFVRELLVAQNSDFLGKVKIGTESDYAQLNVGAPTNLVTPTYAARFESELGDDSDLARGVLINFPHTTNGNSILFHAMSGPGPYTNSRVVIKADGKVGIGTSYPEATLHVHGDLRVDGAFAGDGSGLTNLPVTGLTTNAADARYVNASGDTMAGSLVVAGGISSAGFTLTNSGAPSLNMVNDGDYSVLRNAYSEIWFGTPYDPSLWFNYAAGTNVYFGDVNNFQNICMYGDLHVSGTINGDGSGLINLPVTGLTTNEADARYATVAQGALADTALQPGTAITVASVHILGNSNAAPGSVVAGGSNNLAGTNSFIGGGQYNYGIADYSVVAGGYANMVYAPYSAILGGQYNRASGTCSVVVGGYNNSILSNGYSQYSSIVCGNGNSIQRGSYSFIGGGYGNVVNYTGPSYGGAFIGGGYSNRVAGRYSVIPGGYANVASGLYSFAAGSFANAGHQSAFVWSDSSSGNPFSSTQPNQFLIRATGGVGINTNGTWGKALAVAGDVECAGTGRFTVGLLVPQQGDISMGSYTNGTF